MVNMYEDLVTRVTKEMQQWEDNVDQEIYGSPLEVLYDRSYEFTIKKELVNFVESNEECLTEEAISKVLETVNSLENLYQEWIKADGIGVDGPVEELFDRLNYKTRNMNVF